MNTKLLPTIAATVMVAMSSTASASLQPALQPNQVCTTSQKAMMHLGVRLQFYVDDIDSTVSGPPAEAAENALLDLLASIDRSLPASCQLGG